MLTKGEKIREARKKTREKRKSQVCRIFYIKVEEKKLNKLQKEQIKMCFVEGNRFRNHVIGWSNETNNSVFDFNTTKCKSVLVKNKDGNLEEKPLLFLPASLKQTILNQMCANIKTISTKKKNKIDKIVGRLKFKSELKALNYRQYGYRCSHYIKDSKRIKLQGISGFIHVRGLNQFLHIDGIEYANFKLLNRPNGYYIQVVTYTPKENIIKEDSNLHPIGIDFGCRDSFTFSTGEKVSVKIEESERIKRQDKKLKRQIKGSNNYNKTRRIIGKEYQKLTNKKNDATNKFVAKLKKHKLIVIQNEQLQNWMKNNHGKAVHHSILGRVKTKLKELPQTVILDKMIPTTKLCSKCGNTYDITRKNRVFECPYCGETHDRDVHAAENMLWIVQTLFKSSVPMGHREIKRVEFLEELGRYFNNTESHRTEKHETDNS